MSKIGDRASIILRLPTELIEAIDKVRSKTSIGKVSRTHWILEQLKIGIDQSNSNFTKNAIECGKKIVEAENNVGRIIAIFQLLETMKKKMQFQVARNYKNPMYLVLLLEKLQSTNYMICLEHANPGLKDPIDTDKDLDIELFKEHDEVVLDEIREFCRLAFYKEKE